MNTLLAPDLRQFSRREFLKLLSNGGLALFWLVGRQRLQDQPALSAINPLAVDRPVAEDTPLLGRVLDNSLAVYNRPSFSARLVNVYWRDLVYPINAVTIGDHAPEHNRVWYLINNEGYVHSGMVQPVALTRNEPVKDIPPGGLLAEISVPFSDARRSLNIADRIAYRLYYGTTQWIREALTDKNGQWWYRVVDDKYFNDPYWHEYFIDARHLRPIDASELTPISILGNAEKRLEVRLADQVVVAYEDEQAVFMTRVSSGGRFIEGDYSTPTGVYQTNRKRPSRHMAAGDLASSSRYDLPGVPWVCYLTLSGISFHGTYWHNDFGKPRSHGCLNLSTEAARWIYRWTLPSVPVGEETNDADQGTRVDIVE